MELSRIALASIVLGLLTTACGAHHHRPADALASDFNPTAIAVSQPYADDENLSSSAPTHILFLMQKGRITQAIQHYRSYVEKSHSHDFTLLRQLAIMLLEHGHAQGEIEDQLMAMFGAGIAADPQLLPILRSGLASSHPQVQMVAVDLLARLQDDAADDLLNRAMSSPYLSTRFQAVYQLAAKRYPTAVYQLEALMAKVPSELRPLFPQLFTMVGDRQANSILKQLLADPSPVVQRAAILSAAKADRDDLLPQIRALATQPHNSKFRSPP